MSLLIKNGRIITADADYVADIFVDGEIIHTIGKNLPVNADDVIDATGKLVFARAKIALLQVPVAVRALK